MDSLMPALVAALLAQATDRSPWLAAKLADRAGRPGAVIAATVIAQALLMGSSALAAIWMGNILTPEARKFLFGVSLVAAAIGAAIRTRPPHMERIGGGTWLAALVGMLAMGIGDRTHFIAFGAAASAAHPWLAALGAALGACAPCVAAAILGERAWRALPLRAIGLCASGLLGIAGLWANAAGLGLI